MKTFSRTRKIALAAALIGALCSGSYVLGQNDQTDAKEFEKQITDVDLELNGFGDNTPNEQSAKAAAIAKQATGDAFLTDVVIKQAFLSKRTGNGQYNGLKLQTLQIAQNQRIIELLEKIAAQKKGE